MCSSALTQWSMSKGTTASHLTQDDWLLSVSQPRPQEQFVVFALIMNTELRKKADWLKASSGASVKDKGFGNKKCNPKEFELAVLLESLVHIFAPKPLAAMRRQFNGLFLWSVSQAVLPEDIKVQDVFSLGSTRSAKELTAVAPYFCQSYGTWPWYSNRKSGGNGHATRHKRAPYF